MQKIKRTIILPFLLLKTLSTIGTTIERRWDVSEPIEYSFDGSLTTKEQNYIKLAVEYWQNGTCLNFDLRDDVPHWNRVVFQKSTGCNSMIGPLPGNDVQFVNLNSICSEKQRADRDNFIEIKWSNIEESLHQSYELTKDSLFDLHKIPYDFGSIMHYTGYIYALSSLYANEMDLSILELATVVGVQRASRENCAKRPCHQSVYDMSQLIVLGSKKQMKKTIEKIMLSVKYRYSSDEESALGCRRAHRI
uniref:Metalloendopeptidase n=1 Tax=Romanomermis culicivorax TaxID=13658 RepID=A0A915LA03_ROMCU